jgi:hypothetical protein
MAVAILRVRIEDPIDFTVADGVAIPKGTLLKLTDGRVAIAASGAGDMIAGIAARDKIASDGRTQLAVFTRGIFDMEADGTIAVGGAVMADGTGSTVIASTGVAGAAQIGYSLEAVTDGEIGQVMVNIGASGAIA